MIDFIYTNGCSWTDGVGIEKDPYFLNNPDTIPNIKKKYSWPAVLSKNLNLEYFNDALGGGSNARILRTTTNFVLNYPKEKYQNLLVIIGWTTVDRNEIYIDQPPYQGWALFNSGQKFSETIHFKLDKDYIKRIDEFQKNYLIDLFSYRCNYIRFFQEMYLLKNLLENNNIKYLFFSSLPWRHVWTHPHEVNITTEFEKEILQLKDPKILNTRDISDNYNVMSQFVSANNIPISSCIHPMILGHKLWAEHIQTEIEKIFYESKSNNRL